MYPNAGDVQAPTPSETPSNSRKKHVYREEWEMDEGAYGSNRRETPYSMSSSDLNAVVAHSPSPGVGVDESECGVPDEELAYLASDSYTQALSRSQSRSQSPVLTRDSKRISVDGHHEIQDEEDNVIHVEDPAHGPGYFRRGNSDNATSRAPSHHPDEDDEEEAGEQYSILAEDEVQKRQQSQYMQAAVYTPSYTPRHPRSRPASVLGDVEGASLALSTKFEKNGLESRDSRRTSHTHTPYDRTPYEPLSPADENAKPLFPESDDEEVPKNPVVEKLKRPGMSEHRFPSNDVWEEAPEHAQLEAEIETPPPGEVKLEETAEEYDHQEEKPRKKSENEPKLQYIRGQPHEHYEPGDEQEYERKEKEAARKVDDYHLDLKDLPEDERLHRLHKNIDTDRQTPESSTSRRGTSKKKFPSNDIWEEVPPSQDLQEELDDEEVPASEKERVTTGDIAAVPEPTARPTTSAPIEPSTSKPTVPAKPIVPTRPNREKKVAPATIHEQSEPAAVAPEKKAPPAIPDRPKPNVPARPIGKLASFVKAQPEDPPEPKPKPPVPSRGKIAALKAGFLGDLESRLKLGPMAPPKKEEKKEEKALAAPAKEETLTDVRKSRARGPKGRKLPTKEEKSAAAVEVPKGSEIVGVWTVFTLDTDLDAVLVNPVSEKPARPVSKGDTLVVPKDDNVSSGSPVEEKEEKKVPTAATESVATTTLPSAAGTGEQEVPATEAASEPKSEEVKTGVEEEKSVAAEDGNTTAILTGEHPEDAVAPTAEEVEAPKATPESVADEELKEPEKVSEGKVEKRVNKEG